MRLHWISDHIVDFWAGHFLFHIHILNANGIVVAFFCLSARWLFCTLSLAIVRPNSRSILFPMIFTVLVSNVIYEHGSCVYRHPHKYPSLSRWPFFMDVGKCVAHFSFINLFARCFVSPLSLFPPDGYAFLFVSFFFCVYAFDHCNRFSTVRKGIFFAVIF